MDESVRAALAEYRAAKRELGKWGGGYGPAAEVTAAEDRLERAAHRLAEAVDETES